MSPPRCGLTTVVVPLSTWSPVNTSRSSSRKKQRWFGAWPGVCIASSRNSVPSIVDAVVEHEVELQVELVGLGRSCRIRRSARRSASRMRRAAGQWSGCVCVSSTQRTRSRIDAPMIASTCLSSAGPGSITATSSMPTRYVFVPGPVIRPGFGASDAPDERRQRARDARDQARGLRLLRRSTRCLRSRRVRCSSCTVMSGSGIVQCDDARRRRRPGSTTRSPDASAIT